MSFNSTIRQKHEFTPVPQKRRFEYVDRNRCKTGIEAMNKYSWATTWGRSVGGWMVFDSEATREDWMRNG